MAKLRIKRKAYTRKDGTRVKATTFKVKDRGARGRTPKAERWFEPGVKTGWSKDLAQGTRINKVVRAHKGDLLASARSLRALANVTTDSETRRKAASDANILFKRHKRGK